MYDSSLMALLTAQEVSYGTDPGADYQGILLTEGADIQPVGAKIDRKVMTSHRSALGSVIGAKGWNLTIPCELKGGGLTGSALNKPEFDHLLQASAMGVTAGCVITLSGVSGSWEAGEVVTNTTTSGTVGTLLNVVVSGSNTTLFIHPLDTKPSDTDSLAGATSAATGTVSGAPADSWVYYPLSDHAAYKSATAHFHWDGVRHIATGLRADWEVTAEVSGYAAIKFTGQGVYNDPTNIALPSPALNGVLPPVVQNAGLQIINDGSTVDMSKTAVKSLQLKGGNQIKERNDMNAIDGRRSIEILGARQASGSIDPEVMALADFDIWTAWKDATTQRLYATLGADAGNRVHLLVTNAQADEVKYQDRDGTLAYNLPFTPRALTSAGNDEYFLVFY